MVKDECCFLVCSVCFLVSPRIKCSEMAPPTVIWVLPHQSPNTKRHHRPTCWGVGGHFSVEDPSSQVALASDYQADLELATQMDKANLYESTRLEKSC